MVESHQVNEGAGGRGDFSEGHRGELRELAEGEASRQRVAGVVPAAFFIAAIALGSAVDIDPAFLTAKDGRGELSRELVERILSRQQAIGLSLLLLSEVSLDCTDCKGGRGELLLHRLGVEGGFSVLGNREVVFDAEVNQFASIGGQSLVVFQGGKFVTLIDGDSARVGAGRVSESLLEVSDTLIDFRERGVGIVNLSAAMEGVGEVVGGHMRGVVSGYRGE